MKIVVAGATGFVGKALTEKLSGSGHEVFVLTRSVQEVVRETGGKTLVPWDGKTSGDWAAYLDGADAVINLAGENIAAQRWTAARKQEIVSSRVDATRVIVKAIGQARKKPAILINASAVGYYGNVPDLELTEASGRGEGFLAETCEQWESEARKAEPLGVRVILARLGPVLGEKGGMLSKMIPPFRFFMGVLPGTGRQWIPWVHRDDVINIFLFMLEHPELSGPVHVTGPIPMTMSEFCSALAKVLDRPCGFPVPGFLLRMFLGDRAAIVLASQRALPQKLLQAGYEFRYFLLRPALESILKKRA